MRPKSKNHPDYVSEIIVSVDPPPTPSNTWPDSDFIRSPRTDWEKSEAARLRRNLAKAKTPEQRRKAENELGEFDRDVMDC
jgi:hypothetical protein